MGTVIHDMRGATNPLDRPILDITMDYESDDPHERARREPDVEKVMRRIMDDVTGDPMGINRVSVECHRT